MSKENSVPITTAIRLLRDKGVAFDPALYDYVEHGGTHHAAAELGVDEHATVKTIVMEIWINGGRRGLLVKIAPAVLEQLLPVTRVQVAIAPETRIVIGQ